MWSKLNLKTTSIRWFFSCFEFWCRYYNKTELIFQVVNTVFCSFFWIKKANYLKTKNLSKIKKIHDWWHAKLYVIAMNTTNDNESDIAKYNVLKHLIYILSFSITGVSSMFWWNLTRHREYYRSDGLHREAPSTIFLKDWGLHNCLHRVSHPRHRDAFWWKRSGLLQ